MSAAGLCRAFTKRTSDQGANSPVVAVMYLPEIDRVTLLPAEFAVSMLYLKNSHDTRRQIQYQQRTFALSLDRAKGLFTLQLGSEKYGVFLLEDVFSFMSKQRPALSDSSRPSLPVLNSQLPASAGSEGNRRGGSPPSTPSSLVPDLRNPARSQNSTPLQVSHVVHQEPEPSSFASPSSSFVSAASSSTLRRRQIGLSRNASFPSNSESNSGIAFF